MLDESLAIVEGLWSGAPFGFEGRHYRFEPMTFRPTPVQQPRIPIWVIGAWPNERSVRRALRFDGIIPRPAIPPRSGTWWPSSNVSDPEIPGRSRSSWTDRSGMLLTAPWSDRLPTPGRRGGSSRTGPRRPSSRCDGGSPADRLASSAAEERRSGGPPRMGRRARWRRLISLARPTPCGSRGPIPRPASRPGRPPGSARRGRPRSWTRPHTATSRHARPRCQPGRDRS